MHFCHNRGQSMFPFLMYVARSARNNTVWLKKLPLPEGNYNNTYMYSTDRLLSQVVLILAASGRGSTSCIVVSLTTNSNGRMSGRQEGLVIGAHIAHAISHKACQYLHHTHLGSPILQNRSCRLREFRDQSIDLMVAVRIPSVTGIVSALRRGI